VTLIEGQGLLERGGHGQNASVLSRWGGELDGGRQAVLGGPAWKRSGGPAGRVEWDGQTDQVVPESELV
jgi:hypothetical protein